VHIFALGSDDPLPVVICLLWSMERGWAWRNEDINVLVFTVPFWGQKRRKPAPHIHEQQRRLVHLTVIGMQFADLDPHPNTAQ
jgi:hypothetical protein